MPVDRPNLPAVNGARLWQSLMDMAQIGATDKGGVRRLAMSDEDKAGRDLFTRWTEAAGCTMTVDKIGNMFARRSGRDESLAPVVIGSHLDSQPTGGKFDGVYGVLAGLELVRTLNDLNIETLRPIEVVSWTNEEGSRFAPAMMGSGVYVGALPFAETLATTALDGASVGDELARIGYAGSAPCGGRDLHAYFEAHIEQGPILEAENKTIGVVQGIQGLRWFDCTIEGTDAHAGPTPMTGRRDALLGAARAVQAINDVALRHGPDGRTTVGQMQVLPNSRNVIPGAVTFTVDARHPEADILATMADALRAAIETACTGADVNGTIKEIWYSPPTKFDDSCIAAVRNGAEAAGATSMPITSGAGHDAKYMADICPTAMVFIPCKDGLSHNELESATEIDIATGCQVLLNAAIEKANEPE